MATLKSFAGLNDSNFAKSLREKKKNQSNCRTTKKITNLITEIENYLIAWEPTDCCLMVKNLMDSGAEPTLGDLNKSKSRTDSYLSLSLTDPPVFDIQEIEASLDGSHVMLSGPQGVACVELPSSWTCFDSAKNVSEKIARSFYIGEKQLLCASRLRVQHAKWYPGSPSNSHVMILTSDNNLRIYDIYNPNRPEKTISVGPNAHHSSMRSSSTVTFSSFLEDVAVDFDFGLPSEEHDAKSGLEGGGRDATQTEKTPTFQWPVYILFGNGHVYTFLSSLKSSRTSKTTVRGPLTMWPPADDNYGSDACSLLCLPVSPPVLVIAHQQGIVHHAILLPRSVELEDNEDEKRKLTLPDDLHSLLSWASMTSTDINSKADGVLYVTETLELEGDILEDDKYLSEDFQDEDQNAFKLWKDPSCSSRYLISHDYGVHAVVVPLVNKLWELASKPDQDVGTEDTKQAVTEESVVEFILCTRMKASEPAPPQGVVLHSLPPTLFVLLSSADIRVIPLSLLLKPSLKLTPFGEEMEPTKATRESFEVRIRQLLQRSQSQPKLSLPAGTDLPVTEVIKLFSRCVQILREEYIMKQDVVREELEKRSRLLEIHRQQQLDELDLIQKSKTELTNTAHRLAEKYEDAKEAQERFVERVEKVLYEIQRRSPIMSDAEKQMHIQMRQFDAQLNKIRQNLEALRRREQHYSSKVSQSPASNVGPAGHLNEQQITNLHEILTKQSEDIGALTKNVQLIKKELGM